MAQTHDRRSWAADLLPGLAAADAGGGLRHHIRPGPRLLVGRLDQDPASLARLGEAESAAELLTAQDEGEVVGLSAQDLDGPLVPDDHRSATAALTSWHAFELARRQGVVLDRDSQSPHGGIQGRPLRDGPGTEDATNLQAQIEVQAGRVV